MPVQGQVFHTDLNQIAQAFPNLIQHKLGDLLLVGGQLEGGKEFRTRPDAHQVDIGQGFTPNPIQQALRFEARAPTVFTQEIAPVAGQKNAHVHFIRFGFQPLEPAPDTVVVIITFHDGLLLL